MTKRLFASAGYGIVTAFIIILVVAFVLTTLLKLTSISEASFGQLPMLITSLIALFIGGIIAGGKMKEKGLFVGASTGFIYSALIYLILYLGFDSGAGSHQYMTFFVNVIVTGMGGVVGVNLFAKNK